jgi:hypothetical protein
MRASIASVVSILIIIFALSHISCVDHNSHADGNFFSGPAGGGHSDFAPGVIASLGTTLGMHLRNINTNGSYENVQLMTRGEGTMGLVLEDTFRYAIQKGVADNNMELIAAAAQLRVLMVAFYADVYILVNKSSEKLGGGPITCVADLAGKKVCIAEENSGTYITAKTILDTYTFGTPPDLKYDSTRTALPKVLSGEYDALIKVTADKAGYFGSIKPTDNVTFIRAELGTDKTFYDHTGIISMKEFPFLDKDITNNIRVRVLLVGMPEFDDRDMAKLLDDIYSNSEKYASEYSDIWNSVSIIDSLHYFGDAPYAWNLKCASYFTGIDPVSSAQANLACGTVGGSTEIIADDIIPLIKDELGVTLEKLNTSGSPEMVINIANGNAAMAIVIDDVYEYLNNLDNYYDQFTALGMKKIMPLFLEDCHLLVNASSGINTMADLANKKVCVCEKTSGTFIVARNILRTYGFTKDNAPTYYFDSPSVAIPKVASGEYDAMFKVSAQPYKLFKDVSEGGLLTSGSNVKLIQVKVRDGTVSADYETRTIVHTPYPFQASDIADNICVRGVLVASPAINDSSAGDLIEAIYQATSGFDPDYWGEITKANGLQYFKKKPYGWSKLAAKYFLSELGYTVKD